MTQVMSDEDWAALSPGEKMRNILTWGGKAIASSFGMGAPGMEAVEHPKTTLATAAIPVVATKAPGILARAFGVSKARAGANIGAATTAAREAAVDVSGPGQAALRIMDISERGASMPQAVRRFLQRATDPAKGPLTFEEARDYYSNLSRLSSAEFNRMTPTIQREVGALTRSLHDAMVAAADTAGVGGQYAAGIQEYARAARAATRGKALAKYGGGAVGAGVAGNYVLDRIVNALTTGAGTGGSRSR
jgi:hypothetical protein